MEFGRKKRKEKKRYILQKGNASISSRDRNLGICVSDISHNYNVISPDNGTEQVALDNAIHSLKQGDT